jgi:tetratricopeptide (TPR) repeat protein
VQQEMADYAAAAASQEQALRLHRDLGSRYGEAHALTDLGIVQYLMGNYIAAAASQEQALELHRSVAGCVNLN